jgi:hypothetical protein
MASLMTPGRLTRSVPITVVGEVSLPLLPPLLFLLAVELLPEIVVVAAGVISVNVFIRPLSTGETVPIHGDQPALVAGTGGVVGGGWGQEDLGSGAIPTDVTGWSNKT